MMYNKCNLPLGEKNLPKQNIYQKKKVQFPQQFTNEVYS